MQKWWCKVVLCRNLNGVLAWVCVCTRHCIKDCQYLAVAQFRLHIFVHLLREQHKMPPYFHACVMGYNPSYIFFPFRTSLTLKMRSKSPPSPLFQKKHKFFQLPSKLKLVSPHLFFTMKRGVRVFNLGSGIVSASFMRPQLLQLCGNRSPLSFEAM